MVSLLGTGYTFERGRAERGQGGRKNETIDYGDWRMPFSLVITHIVHSLPREESPAGAARPRSHLIAIAQGLQVDAS